MSKSINVQSNNAVTITGKLNDVVVREGTSKNGGKPYRAGTVTIRVEQTYGGKSEISEIPVQFIAMKFKKDGTNNPAYESIGQLSTQFKSIQNYGYDEASRIRVNGKSGNISENMFVGRDGEQVVSSWRINSSFFNEVRGGDAIPANSDCATFNIDIFIMSMARELTAEGEETGRLKIRGGVIQYGSKLDCLDFYVEDPTAVDYIERNWNMNDTVNAVGRIRYTSEIVTNYHSDNAWGEAIPQTTTKTKRELIITHGSDEPFDEDMAYAPEDIQVVNADRNNRKEQLKMEARSKATQKAAKPVVETGNYGWEE